MSDPIRLLIVDDHPVVRNGLHGMFAGDPAATSAEIAVTPSISGIRRSIRITSGASAPARRTASAPFPASPTTSNPGSPSNIPINPLRTTGWSSTIITRIGAFTRSPPGRRAPTR